MKNIIIPVFFSLSLFLSCNNSEEYPEQPSTVLKPDTPELLAVNPGYNRAEIIWNRNDAEYASGNGYVYWNNGTDSVFVSGLKTDSQIKSIIEIPEGEYDIYVKNVSPDGIVSSPSNSLHLVVYGDDYSENVEKTIISYAVFQKGSYIMSWNKSHDCIGIKVFYNDESGKEQIIESKLEDNIMYLHNIAEGENISYECMYKPGTDALDIVTIKSDDYILPMAGNKITVDNFDEMLLFLSMDNVDVSLKKGSFSIKAEDLAAGKHRGGVAEIEEGQKCYVLLLVHGSNSTFDFGGSTIEIETGTFHTNAFGRKHSELYGLHTLGNKCTVKNLKLIDVGDESDYPLRGYTNVVMDGSDNVIDNIEVIVKSN